MMNTVTSQVSCQLLPLDALGNLIAVDAVADNADAAAENLTVFARHILEETQNQMVLDAKGYRLVFEKLGVSVEVEPDFDQGVAVALRTVSNPTGGQSRVLSAHIEPYALELGEVAGVGSVLNRLAWLISYPAR